MNIRPEFTRKKVAAERLLMTERNLNRLIADGKMQGVQLSDNRSGVATESLDAYIGRARGLDRFISEMRAIELAMEREVPAGAAEAIDKLLMQRFPGIVVSDEGNKLCLMWAASLPYAAKDVVAYLAKLPG